MLKLRDHSGAVVFEGTAEGLPAGIESQTVTLDDTAIKALRPNGQLVVPSPDPATFLYPLAAVVTIDATGGAYVVGNGNLFIATETDFENLLQFQTVGNALEDASLVWLAWLGRINPDAGFFDAASVFLGQGLRVYVGGAGAITGGDAANRLRLALYYLPLSFA